jgi:hypothetical protein
MQTQPSFSSLQRATLESLISRKPVPVFLVALSVAASLAVALSAPPAVRAVFVVPFLLVAPGLAWTRLLHLERPEAEVMLAVAASLSFETLVALALVYSHVWVPKLGLVVFVAVTLAGVLVDLRTRAEQP